MYERYRFKPISFPVINPTCAIHSFSYSLLICTLIIHSFIHVSFSRNGRDSFLCHSLFLLVLHCLPATESDVIHFDGRSSLALRFPQKSVRSLKDVLRLRFKALGADGTLLHGEGHQGDRLTLELRQGRLHLHVSLGA